jgi:hypothetical protein
MAINPFEAAIIPYTPPWAFLQAPEHKFKGDPPMTDRVVVLTQLFFRSNPFAEVFQSEVGFTTALDAKPIISSYGAGPCVIVGGYNLHTKTAFLAHFSHAGEVHVGATMIMERLKALVENKQEEFLLTLKGGIIGDPISEKTMKSIATWVLSYSQPKGISFKIVSQESLKSFRDESKSLSIDTRTGAINQFDPLNDNPLFYRHLTLEDINRARISFEVMPCLTVVYPKTFC